MIMIQDSKAIDSKDSTFKITVSQKINSSNPSIRFDSYNSTYEMTHKLNQEEIFQLLEEKIIPYDNKIAFFLDSFANFLFEQTQEKECLINEPIVYQYDLKNNRPYFKIISGVLGYPAFNISNLAQIGSFFEMNSSDLLASNIKINFSESSIEIEKTGLAGLHVNDKLNPGYLIIEAEKNKVKIYLKEGDVKIEGIGKQNFMNVYFLPTKNLDELSPLYNQKKSEKIKNSFGKGEINYLREIQLKKLDSYCILEKDFIINLTYFNEKMQEIGYYFAIKGGGYDLCKSKILNKEGVEIFGYSGESAFFIKDGKIYSNLRKKPSAGQEFQLANYEIDNVNIENQIRNYIQQKDCYVAVKLYSYSNTGETSEISINENYRMHTMSAFKAALATFFYMNMPESSWQEAEKDMDLMLTASINQAATRIFYRLAQSSQFSGKNIMEEFNKFFNENRMTETYIQGWGVKTNQVLGFIGGYMPPTYGQKKPCISDTGVIFPACNKATTAEEWSSFYKKLYFGELTWKGKKITSRQRQKLLDMLHKIPEEYNRGYSTTFIVDGSEKFYTKTGSSHEIPITYNDAGIVISTSRTSILVILIMQNVDYSDNSKYLYELSSNFGEPDETIVSNTYAPPVKIINDKCTTYDESYEVLKDISKMIADYLKSSSAMKKDQNSFSLTNFDANTYLKTNNLLYFVPENQNQENLKDALQGSI